MADIAELLRAVGEGDLARVRAALADSPALVNARGPHPFWGGRPQPLHVAIETGHAETFEVLLAHGADVNGANEEYEHWSPLMLAIQRRRDAMRDTLLARGARVGLAEALMLGDDERATAIIEREGLPPAAPSSGSWLACARTPAAVDALLAAGADAVQPDRWDTRPIDTVSAAGPAMRVVVRHMVARGVPASPAVWARVDDRERLDALVHADASVARRADVLLAALDTRHHELVRWLIAHGADVNTRFATGSRHTPLHVAAWNGDLPMTTLLVEAGADREARDLEHQGTPRDWAETSRTVTRNPACDAVVAYLDARTG